MRRILPALLLSLILAGPALAADPPAQATKGIASWYGPGHGVATKWCTWTLRHSAGCGYLAIYAEATGRTVVAPVIDWCQCYRGTPDERIVDLQLGVVADLGLKQSTGLYRVSTWAVELASDLPNTAMSEADARLWMPAIFSGVAILMWILGLAGFWLQRLIGWRGKDDDRMGTLGCSWYIASMALVLTGFLMWLKA